ncbi:Era-like GTP-binding protein [Thermosynechococcus sp. JY1334]|uniref:Era-like GTP-binding protein n=1 Tax=unclassified Thermosynechococcus TaxID=2622553 RepID=UPI0026711CF6|nr:MULTISPECIES: Era-like GTP-binding protein [unclassified Thermosynechococcus]MDR7898733.1 Era-like GTP-binding protein [Thermosynechococcus sp. JY1332]MDR7906137.1 Era-like GTP-binding protein [Thermosynechococcus sp. JY1334]MDR7993956.1 Era-like GTP-binding protein [Thermosynechococcus sp. TG252]WKT85864.1 Era-like GTP-binding protein [Thermosynechococcus sp. JY1339]WNC54808.1 Era-like GTP-binding protein [Thermosynechococcus sp. JY1331]
MSSLPILDITAKCLEELLAWHQVHHPQLSAQWQPLYELRDRLHQSAWHIVVLGQVSRGKSALLNALYGEAIFPVGALHGTTRWPRTVRWHCQDQIVDLTDTPGLDEVAGSNRESMTWSAVETADLVLFVTQDSLTPVECQARDRLNTLRIPHKLILTKADLYPPMAEGIAVSSTTGQGIPELRQLLQQWLQQEAPQARALRILHQASQVEQNLGAALGTQNTSAWSWLTAQMVGSALLPGGFFDVVLAIVSTLAYIRKACQAYAVPFPLPAFGSLSQFVLLWYAAIYLSSWQGLTFGSELWGVNTTVVLQGGVIFWGYQQIRRRLDPYLQQGYQWGHHGPQRLLQQLTQTRANVTASG